MVNQSTSGLVSNAHKSIAPKSTVPSGTVIPFRKKKTIESHQTNYLLGGTNLTPLPRILRIIQYKTLSNEFNVIFYIPI